MTHRILLNGREIWFDDYVYRFVAVKIMGEPNTARIQQMVARGWEPVPTDEWPDDIKPVEATASDSLVLYRCPDVLAHERAKALQEHNAREQNPETHVARANAAIDAYVAALPKRADGRPANHGWSRIGGAGRVVGPNITVTYQSSRYWRAE